MDTFIQAIILLVKDWDTILELTLQHIYMSFSGVLLSILAGIPLAIIMSRNEKLAILIQTIVNAIQTIPSIALLLVIMIFFGLGSTTAIVALFFYSLLPIISNTYIGLKGVDKHLIEAGLAMGMTNQQLYFKVKLPLAFPIILAGIRIATVIAIGVATIATFVGAGGLGDWIYRGIMSTDDVKILSGSIPAALLAISVDFFLRFVEKKSGIHLHKTKPQE
ncbi:ABC transporter permease [Neobacillus terrae]|uniref:ABC transporter permease n=1 Tax=Neobacillus terrae TaxID=3034837 RepID=UPI001408B161|nr:ABC transporter permease [Neobacillus terrae]NHM30682.1 ABC transporter permease [Neobacillus terrae]